MLGAITMAMSCAAAAISAFCASLKPVVPMTACTPSSRQDGQVRQRAFGAREVDQHLGVLQARAQVGHDRHAAGEAEEGGRIVADGRAARRCRARRPAGSRCASRMASISMWPMRPEAPATATRRSAGMEEEESVTRVSLGSFEKAGRRGRRALARRFERRIARRQRRQGGGRARRRLLVLGRLELLQLVFAASSTGTLPLRLRVSSVATNSSSLGIVSPSKRSSTFALEIHRQATLLRLDALALDREHVVPAVGVEDVVQERGAQDFAHLLARSCRA